ncbi:MAG: response regulator [Rhodospirillales bacterium]
MRRSRDVRNILVVEGDKDTNKIITRALERDDLRLTMTLTMEEALLGFGDLPYELVITGIFMEGMGGIEGIQRMRAIRPTVKILATSAGHDEMSSAFALKAAAKIGADAIIPKPFGPDELRAAVEGMLDD